MRRPASPISGMPTSPNMSVGLAARWMTRATTAALMGVKVSPAADSDWPASDWKPMTVCPMSRMRMYVVPWATTASETPSRPRRDSVRKTPIRTIRRE